MCVKNNTIIYVARASNSKRDCGAWSLLLLAATVRSFAHMPLGISDRNEMVLWFESAQFAKPADEMRGTFSCEFCKCCKSSQEPLKRSFPLNPLIKFRSRRWYYLRSRFPKLLRDTAGTQAQSIDDWTSEARTLSLNQSVDIYGMISTNHRTQIWEKLPPRAATTNSVYIACWLGLYKRFV